MRILLSFIFILSTLGYVTCINASIPTPVQSFATLPQPYLDTKTQQITEAFEQRALLFLKGRNYKTWATNKPKDEILKEYEQLNEWRFHTWYVDPNAKVLVAREDFMIAQDLLEKGFYRKPNTIAFQYNQTDGSYNSSSIVINGFHFLALEAPTAKNIKNFFTLLQNYHVTHLVRLTNAQERGVERSYPYWKDKLKIEKEKSDKPEKNENSEKTEKSEKSQRSRSKINDKNQAQALVLKISQDLNPAPYRIRYYFTDNWVEGEALDPKELLKLIQATQKNFDPSQDVLACHCSSGVGRTGTFLAGLLLISEIDKKIAAGTSKKNLNISIERIVMQLSLQRPYMVSDPEQYVALYRLVDLYLQQLK